MKIYMHALQPWDIADIPKAAMPRMCQDTRGILARCEDSGKLLASIVMDSWTKGSCMTHIYVANPIVLRHGFLEEVADFIFNKAGCEVIIGSTPADNKKALKFNKHIGFEEVFRIKDGYEKGIDIVVTEMRKSTCRWLKTPLQQAA